MLHVSGLVPASIYIYICLYLDAACIWSGPCQVPLLNLPPHPLHHPPHVQAGEHQGLSSTW